MVMSVLLGMSVTLGDSHRPRFSVPDRSRDLLLDAQQHAPGGGLLLAPVGARRHADELCETAAEAAERRAADLEADLGDAEVPAPEQRHGALDPTGHEVAVGRLAIG